MESEGAKSWEELRREEPLNERRVSVYRQLLEAQELVAASRMAVGVSEAAIDAAFEGSGSASPEHESDEDLYVGTLGRFVEALGGRLEGFRAAFADGSVTLPPLGR
jgi:hypothetical protein